MKNFTNFFVIVVFVAAMAVVKGEIAKNQYVDEWTDEWFDDWEDVPVEKVRAAAEAAADNWDGVNKPANMSWACWQSEEDADLKANCSSAEIISILPAVADGLSTPELVDAFKASADGHMMSDMYVQAYGSVLEYVFTYAPDYYMDPEQWPDVVTSLRDGNCDEADTFLFLYFGVTVRFSYRDKFGTNTMDTVLEDCQ